MGQYYKPIFLKENNQPAVSAYSHDFGSGLKLMEHSWRLNAFVRFIEFMITDTPKKLVWAGDYADNEKDVPLEVLKKVSDEDSEYTNLARLKEEGINLYSWAESLPLVTHDERIPKGTSKWDYNFKKVIPLRYKYLVNMDKQEYVNKDEAPNDDGWQIHPLPLLTCEGNGRGGGDYRGNFPYVGSWARDRIKVVSKKSDIPKGFTKLSLQELSE